MTRRAAGMTFIGIAAWLFGMRYLAAALYGAGINIDSQYSEATFAKFLSYVGNLPVILSIISLAFGLVYLIWAEREKG